MGNERVTNIVIAGLGGQGVLKASDIAAEAAFRAGYDVKKSEIHGMSQRGGSVTSDVRFGDRVWSPMVPRGEADYLVLVEPSQFALTRGLLRQGGAVIGPACVDPAALRSPRSLNVALLGALSSHLAIPERFWLEAIQACFSPQLRSANLEAFQRGRNAQARAER